LPLLVLHLQIFGHFLTLIFHSLIHIFIDFLFLLLFLYTLLCCGFDSRRHTQILYK
jgi:hypothetical protein